MRTNFLSFTVPFFSLLTALAADVDPTWVGSWPGFDRSKKTADDVAVSGNHAYVIGWSGLWILDVSDPTHPQLIDDRAYDVGQVWFGTSARRVAVSGTFAYVAGDLRTGLQVIDVTDPGKPRTVGAYVCNASGVAVSGNYAYVTHRNPGGPRYRIPDGANYWLTVIDVSNPAQPRRIGTLDTRQYPLEDLAVSGRYAYVAGRGHFHVIDIRNPASPKWAGWAFSVSSWDAEKVAAADNCAYLASGSEGLKIIEIKYRVSGDFTGTPGFASTALVTPQRIGGIEEAALGAQVKSIAVSGSYVYAAASPFSDRPPAQGLYIFDISKPSVRRPISRYATKGTPMGVAVAGNYAYLVDRAEGEGFIVLDIRDPAKPHRGAGNLAITADEVGVADGHVFVATEPDGLAGLGLYGPRFERVLLSAQGEFRLRIDGPSGATGRLQRSTNLKDWTDWRPVTFAADPMEVSDPGSTSASRRFYRLIVP